MKLLRIFNFFIDNLYSPVYGNRIEQTPCFTEHSLSSWRFLARDSTYAIARPSVHLSVYLSVCLSPLDQSKTIEVRIMQPSPQSSPMTSFLTLALAAKFETEDTERGCRIRQGYEKFAHYMAASIVLRFTRGRHFRTISLLVCLPGIVL